MKLIDTALQRACFRRHDIVAAYIFGSTVKERQTPRSDLDIALILREDVNDFQLFSFIAELEQAVYGKVDVVILNRTGELLKHEVRKYGRLIFDRDTAARKRFEMKGRKLFEDFLYLHKGYVDKVLYRKVHG